MRLFHMNQSLKYTTYEWVKKKITLLIHLRAPMKLDHGQK